MALGLCCQWLALDKKGRAKNILVSKTLRYGRFKDGLYPLEKIREVYLTNLRVLKNTLPLVLAAGIRNMRMSSSMFPLFDKVDRELWDNEEVRSLLSSIGSLVLKSALRFTTHPDQFCVLSSDSKETVANSAAIINHHAWIFDQMGLPDTSYHCINVHGGKSDRLSNLINGINKLNPTAKSRLTLENCEFAYSVKELAPISQKLGVPIVFDSHHHKFRTGDLSVAEAMELAVSTWPEGIKPLTHLSNTKESFIHSEKPRERRQHSDFIYEIPPAQLEAHEAKRIDIDIEAKKKNFALSRMITDFPISLT